MKPLNLLTLFTAALLGFISCGVKNDQQLGKAHIALLRAENNDLIAISSYDVVEKNKVSSE